MYYTEPLKNVGNKEPQQRVLYERLTHKFIITVQLTYRGRG